MGVLIKDKAEETNYREITVSLPKDIIAVRQQCDRRQFENERNIFYSGEVISVDSASINSVLVVSVDELNSSSSVVSILFSSRHF